MNYERIYRRAYGALFFLAKQKVNEGQKIETSTLVDEVVLSKIGKDIYNLCTSPEEQKYYWLGLKNSLQDVTRQLDELNKGLRKELWLQKPIQILV